MKIFNIDDRKIGFDGEKFEFYEIDDSFDKEQIENSKKKEFSLPESLLAKVIFNMSNECNLKCKYCYANGGNYGRKNFQMGEETIDKVISKLKNRNIKEIVQVKFFGGEPLMNKEGILYALKSLSDNFKIEEYLIVTNGILLDKDFLDKIKSYNLFFSLSLDLPERIHNKLRGEGTYKKVIRAIDLLRENGYDRKLKIVSTYTNEQYKEGITMRKYQELLNEIHDIYHINRVHAIKESELNLKNYGVKEKKDEIDLTFNNILGITYGKFLNPTVDRVLRSLIFENKNKSFCDELISDIQLSYDYNGDEYRCNRFWGRLEYSTNEDNEFSKVKKINTKENYKICRNCWCKNLCMICTASIIQDFINEKYGFNSNECINQELFEYTIEKLLKYSIEGKNETIFNNYYEMISQYPE